MYEELEQCLKKLIDEEFKSMFYSLRGKDIRLKILGDNPSRNDFLGAMQTWDSLSDVKIYLCKKYPDRFPSLCHYRDTSVDCLNFIDRENERYEACKEETSQYILFDSPAKYGKTELLKAIKHKYDTKGWACIYTEITKKNSSALELAHKIKENASLYSSFEEMNQQTLRDIGKIVAGKYNGEKLLLLIDSVDRLTEAEFHSFVNEFLYAVHKVIPDVRVQMAGRYISGWKKKLKNIQPKLIQLSPFKFKYVQKAVQSRLHGLDEDAMNLRAASLMHLTGGHIGLMDQIINEMLTQDKEKHLAFIESCKNIVLEKADEIWESIDPDLQGTVEVLSVFRRYDFPIFKKIVEKGMIECKEELESALLVKLEDKSLVSRWVNRPNFMQDEITRRILAVRLSLYHNDKFKKYCEDARDIYKEILSDCMTSPDVIAIEYLYQELQLGFCDEKNRMVLLKNFFIDDGILGKCLELMISRLRSSEESIGQLNSMEALLKSEWEFRFAVNFCLRKGDYKDDDVICNEIYKKIKNFTVGLKKRRYARTN